MDNQDAKINGIGEQLQWPLDYKTQQILAQFVKPAFGIGGVYVSVDSTNPAQILGYGTWEAFAAGKTLIGVDTLDPDFEDPELTGGSKSVTLDISEIPSHVHGGVVTTNGGGMNNVAAGGGFTTSGNTNSAGGGQPHNNLPPYITVYFWKRTA